MKITVAGAGYVGLVAGVCFAYKGHQVTCVDVNEDKIEMMKHGISPVYEEGLEELLKSAIHEGNIHFTSDFREAYKDAEVIFIGVGTPELPDGSADLSFIALAARQIAETVERDCLVVVKSTVPVGTNDKVEQLIHDYKIHNVSIEVASNPEFLAQGSAVHDTLCASRIVIGTESKRAEEILREVYRDFHIPIVAMRRRSAEMAKYACNDFLALKLSYMNELANLCECLGADIGEIEKAMSYDDRIGARFLKAGIGYGGSCFPKDTKALSALARNHGCCLRTVEAAVQVNEEQKVRLFHKAKSRLMTFRGMKAAVLGLAFKPGTDDLREAPSLANISLLLDEGAWLKTYDPAAGEAFRRLYPEGTNRNGRVSHMPGWREALEGADVCFIFTEWPQFLEIRPEDFKQLMRNPLVLDGRNMFDREKMRKCGVVYEGIGNGRERNGK